MYKEKYLLIAINTNTKSRSLTDVYHMLDSKIFLTKKKLYPSIRITPYDLLE